MVLGWTEWAHLMLDSGVVRACYHEFDFALMGRSMRDTFPPYENIGEMLTEAGYAALASA